jgi:hypothetical protein
MAFYLNVPVDIQARSIWLFCRIDRAVDTLKRPRGHQPYREQVNSGIMRISERDNEHETNDWMELIFVNTEMTMNRLCQRVEVLSFSPLRFTET